LGKAIANLDFSNLVGGMEDAYAAAVKLKEAQQALADLQRSQEVANAKAAQQYDELILKSKNRTLTEKQRIAYLNQAQKIEEANFKQRSALADAELKNAIEAARIKGELSAKEIANLKANTLAYGNYLLNTGKITEDQLEAIKKRLEKSQNAEDKLADDAATKTKDRQAKATAAAEKALAASVKSQETEIAIQRAKNAQLRQTDTERLDFLNFISKEEIRLIEFKKSEGLLTEKEAKLASLSIAKTQSVETLALAQKAIDDELTAQTKKTEDKKKLSEQDMLDEVANAAFLREVQVKRIEESKLLESEKASALAEIQKGYNANIELIEQTYKDSRKAQAEIDRQEAQTLADVAAEMRILALEEQGETEAEVQLTILANQYAQKQLALDADLALEKKTAEEVRALKELEDRKYAAATAKIDKQVNAQKRAETMRTVQNGLNAANELFEGSKAVAVATALFNTYQGITAELSTKAVTPYEIGLKVANVAFVAASGFAAVKNILKTDKGGGGGSSSSGATTATPAATFENVARTQTVATVNAAPVQDAQPTNQPVLILETLSEAQKNQVIKINSK
jgi:hypothetical protein